MPGWGLWISGHPAWQQVGARDLVEGLPTWSSLEEPEFHIGPQPLLSQVCGSPGHHAGRGDHVVRSGLCFRL